MSLLAVELRCVSPGNSFPGVGADQEDQADGPVFWLRRYRADVSRHPRPLVIRPHRSLQHRATPATAYTSRPKATPGTDRTRDTHDRVRTDKIDKAGTVTLRHNGRLHHIGIGRAHAGTYVRLLVQDLDITIINATTGEILRELVLDPTKDYQPTGRPPNENNNGPTKS